MAQIRETDRQLDKVILLFAFAPRCVSVARLLHVGPWIGTVGVNRCPRILEERMAHWRRAVRARPVLNG